MATMDAVVGPALDDLKKSLSVALERQLKDRFDEVERREKLVEQRSKQLELHEQTLFEKTTLLDAREEALNQREQALEQREGTSAGSAPKHSALFPKSTAPQSQPAAKAACSTEPTKRVSFSEAEQPVEQANIIPGRAPLFPPRAQPIEQSAQTADQSPQVSGSSGRAPLFPPRESVSSQPLQTPQAPAPQGQGHPLFPPRVQPSEQPPVAAPTQNGSSGRAPLFPQSYGSNAVPQPIASSNAAPQPVAEPSSQVESGQVSRQSAGSATQLKSMFEQKAKDAKKEEPVKRKSWTAVNNELTLPGGSETASFRAHDCPYKAKTAFNKPVREKQSLAELLEKGPGSK